MSQVNLEESLPIEFSKEELKLLLSVCFSGICANNGENYSIPEFTKISEIVHRLNTELRLRDQISKRIEQKKKEEDEEDWNLEPNAGS
jgi:hypothetical protein